MIVVTLVKLTACKSMFNVVHLCTSLSALHKTPWTITRVLLHTAMAKRRKDETRTHIRQFITNTMYSLILTQKQVICKIYIVIERRFITITKARYLYKYNYLFVLLLILYYTG